MIHAHVNLILDFPNPFTQTYQGPLLGIDERVNQATNVLFTAWDFYKYAASESATLVFSDPSGEAYKEASARLDDSWDNFEINLSSMYDRIKNMSPHEVGHAVGYGLKGMYVGGASRFLVSGALEAKALDEGASVLAGGLSRYGMFGRSTVKDIESVDLSMSDFSFGVVVPDGEIIHSRSIAAAHIRVARNFLRDLGIDVEYRNKIIKSFDLETFRIEKTQSSRVEFRVFDDADAELRGRYCSPHILPNNTECIAKFALPNNSASRLAEVEIPKGAIVFTGKVASQKHITPGLIGGEQQTFLTGPIEKYRYKEIYMPRNINQQSMR